MNAERQQTIVTLAPLAVFADSANNTREREQIRRLAESLGGEPGAANLPVIHRKLQIRYLPQIRQNDVGLDATRIVATVRVA